MKTLGTLLKTKQRDAVLWLVCMLPPLLLFLHASATSPLTP